MNTAIIKTELTLGRASWLSSSCKFLMILKTKVLQANGSHRIIERSLQETEKKRNDLKLMLHIAQWFGFYPSTCSCPFLTPSRKPCNSLARLPSTNFSRMQASKHQVNCHRTTMERKGLLRKWSDLKLNTFFQSFTQFNDSALKLN